MNNATTYTFRASEKGILRTLENTFTSKSAFIREAAQNAVRAGATKVCFDYLPEQGVLLIEDNGCGFSDDSWGTFFTIGESGWDDEAMIADQKPYGIGAASMVFAAEQVAITSQGRSVLFDSSSLCGGDSITLADDDMVLDGTLIALRLTTDFFSESGEPSDQFLSIFEGFSLPVVVNGIEINRPWALDCLSFDKSEQGYVWVNDIDKNPHLHRRAGHLSNIERVVYFLQGFRLSESCRGGIVGATAVVHLDSSLFIARVPDRECLINGRSQLKVFDSILRDHRINQCCELVDVLGLVSFASEYWFTGKMYIPDIMATSPVPLKMFGQYEHLHYKLENHESNLESSSRYSGSGVVTEANFSGVVMDHCDEHGNYQGLDVDEDADFTSDCFALFNEIPTINVSDFPEGHWLLSNLQESADKMDQFSLVLNGHTKRFTINTNGFMDQKVVLCDSYSLEWSEFEESATVNNECFVYYGTLIIPSKASYFDDIVRTLCDIGNYSEDEFSVDQSYLDSIADSLASAVSLHRNNNPEALLNKFFTDNIRLLEVANGLLAGEEFSVRFDSGGKRFEPIINKVKRDIRRGRKNTAVAFHRGSQFLKLADKNSGRATGLSI